MSLGEGPRSTQNSLSMVTEHQLCRIGLLALAVWEEPPVSTNLLRSLRLLSRTITRGHRRRPSTMTRVETARIGRLLAERHVEEAEPDQRCCLLNYAEAPFEGDWTLRSSLMRLAQPHPARVGQVLELTRRLDGPLHHVRRDLERHVVLADRALTPGNIEGPLVEAYADIRAADLARLVDAGCDAAGLISGYEELTELTNEERIAVPLLAIAVSAERLASTLSAWALVGPADPPVDAVDQFVATVAEALDELGVPEETGPPPGMRRSGRG